VYDYVPGKAAWLGMGLPFEGEKGPDTRAGAVVRHAGGSVVTEDGIVLAEVVGGEVRPGPSTFRPSVPRDELASYLDDNDLDHALITTLDGRLVGVVRREEL
jgi:hypothetical protein